MGAHASRSREVFSRDDEVRSILDSLRLLVKALRDASREAERRVGLNAAQLFVLDRLREDGPGSVNDLAERTLTHQSSVSVVISRLAAKGLVTRTSAPEDGRERRISITPRGRALLRKAPARVQDRLLSAMSRLPRWQVVGVAEGLESMMRVAGLTGRPGMFFEDERKPGRRRG